MCHLQRETMRFSKAILKLLAQKRETPEDWINYYQNREFEDPSSKPQTEIVQEVANRLQSENLFPYVQWVLTHASVDKILLEDMDHIVNILKKFEMLKPTGKIEKDINRYPDFSSLLQSVGQFEDVDREQYYLPEGSEKGLSGDDYKKFNIQGYGIIQINTVEGATKLCRSTGWCVKDPRFSEAYLSQGPLYLILEGGYKYILVHFPSSQAKDVNDNPINYETTQKIKPIILELAKVSGESIIKDGDFMYLQSIDEAVDNSDNDYIQDVIKELPKDKRNLKLEKFMEEGNVTAETMIEYQSLFPNDDTSFNISFIEEAVVDTGSPSLFRKYALDVGPSDLLENKIKSDFSSGPKYMKHYDYVFISSYLTGLYRNIFKNHNLENIYLNLEITHADLADIIYFNTSMDMFNKDVFSGYNSYFKENAEVIEGKDFMILNYIKDFIEDLRNIAAKKKKNDRKDYEV